MGAHSQGAHKRALGRRPGELQAASGKSHGGTNGPGGATLKEKNKTKCPMKAKPTREKVTSAMKREVEGWRTLGTHPEGAIDDKK